VSRIVPYVVLAAVLAFAVWRRTRRGEARRPRAMRLLSELDARLGTIGLVASREVETRVRGRLFRVGTLLILLGVAAAIVIPTETKGSHTRKVGVVGSLPASLRAGAVDAAKRLGDTISFVAEPRLGAAEADLRSGRSSLAIVDGRRLVSKHAVQPSDSSSGAQLARAIATELGTARAVEAAGLSKAQIVRLSLARPAPITSLETPSKPASPGSEVAGLILLFIMLSQYGGWTLLGVMEEKSSRVVEVLLSTLRPVQLLAGKVLGIGVVVFAQASLVVLVALGVARAVGSNLVHGSTPLAVGATLLWLLLGYAFYSWVYAAAGSMAERRDQVQTLAVPITLPILLGYIIGLSTLSSGSPSVFARVLAYLPPTAPFEMPVLVALGRVAWWQFAGSVAIAIVCTIGLARVSAAIYGRAILHTGGRVRIRDLFAQS
jgi:ABC-2 type transport system permease protein